MSGLNGSSFQTNLSVLNFNIRHLSVHEPHGSLKALDNPYELTIKSFQLYFIVKKNSDVNRAEYQFQNKICVLILQQ